MGAGVSPQFASIPDRTARASRSSPLHRRPSAPAAHDDQIDRQDKEPQRDHPEAENRQETQEAAHDKAASQGDPPSAVRRQRKSATEYLDPSAFRCALAIAFVVLRLLITHPAAMIYQ